MIRALDRGRAEGMFPAVSRLARMLVFFLVAAWLPVTLHCRLEAAGFHAADECCSAEVTADAAGDCKDDACPAVEEALYKESGRSLKVLAPDVAHDFAGLALAAAVLPPTVSPLAPERHEAPPELRVAWQFIARAAPPARAPSSLG